MDDAKVWEVLLQRIGGWCAVAGAVLFVAGGVGYSGLTLTADSELVLQRVADHPIWVWPAVHLAFSAGALLWVCAFMALNSSIPDMFGRILGQFGTVSLLIGAVLYAIDSFLGGFVLTSLADQFAAAPVAERLAIVRSADGLLLMIGGTWAGIMVLFHGVPFVLTGSAVARTARYPRSLRWLGLMSGVGSLITGTLMLIAPFAIPAALVATFAAIGILWMVGVGIVLIRFAAPARRSREALQTA